MTDDASLTAEQTKRPRRAAMFWLTLVTVLLLVAGSAASFVLPFLQRVNAVRQFETQGVGFTIEPHGPDWVRDWFGRDRSVGTSPFGPFDRVTRIDWRTHGDLPPGFFAMLQHFPSVRELHINYAGITDDDLPAITQLKELETLDLAHNRLHGRGFGCLKSLPHLKSVNVTYCPVRDAALDVLVSIPTLEALSVYACRHLSCERVNSFLADRPHVHVVGLRYGGIDLRDCDR